MTSPRTLIVVAIGLIMALAWGVMPPRHKPSTGSPVAVQERLQCPRGASLQGKLCVCGPGTELKGGACVRY